MEFWKMNGNGNDFIVLNHFTTSENTDYPSLARRLCRRKSSIGADGILVLAPSADGHFMMRLFNADGSEGEMCGNGARCIARFAYEQGIAPEKMIFETLAGPIKASVNGSFVELDMGDIAFDPDRVDRTLSYEGEIFRSCYTIAGVPHLALFAGEMPSREECVTIGRIFRNTTDLFPLGTNVNFVVPTGRGTLDVITYERGVENLTDSCGTGSVASALSAALLFDMDSPIEVHNIGGINTVSFERTDDLTFSARLGGETVLVCHGETGNGV